MSIVGSKKDNKNQRRKPRQARSQAKFEAILQVAPRILVEHGYQKTTTELIALEADVSIGTLYEYFADKDDVFAVYLQRQTRAIVSAVSEQVSNNLDATSRSMLETLINMGVDFVFQYQATFSAIIREIPSLWEIEVIQKLEARVIELATLFYRSRIENRADEGITVAVMLTNIVVGFYLRLVLLGSQGMSAAVIKQELMLVVRGYLRERSAVG